MISKIDKYTRKTVETFETVRQAADDAGVPYQSMHKHMRLHQLYTGRWYYRRDMSLEDIENESFDKNHFRPLLVEVSGRSYGMPSARYLADAIHEPFYKVRNGLATGMMKTSTGIIKLSYLER